MILICIQRVAPNCWKTDTQQPYKSSARKNWVCPACVNFISQQAQSATALVNEEADSLFDYLKRFVKPEVNSDT